MLTFIGGVVVFLCVVFSAWFVWSRMNSGSTDSNSFSLNDITDTDLVKRFNELVDSLNSSKKRDLDKIAADMLKVLKEYKCRKVEQFVEAEQLLAKNKNHLNEEIGKVESQIQRLTADAKALVKENMTEDDYEIGALYMAQIDETKKLKADLIATAKENEAQIEHIDKQVKSFNAKYTIKEGSITNMIIKAKTHKNFSTVDLKLNDLISEFNDKVQDIEIEQKVKSQINGPSTEEQESANYVANKDAYIAQFKEFANKN